MSLPPKKTGITTDGHEPANMQLVNDVRASKRASPLSLELTRSSKWFGRRPSGPAEEPAGKDRRHLRTSPVVTRRLNAGVILLLLLLLSDLINGPYSGLLILNHLQDLYTISFESEYPTTAYFCQPC